MAIGAHLEQPRRAVESRVGERRKLKLDAAGASSSEGPVNVVVHDLSETGLLLQTTAQLSIGEKIEVALPHAGPTAASVVWGSNDFFGCRFEKPISRATVSASQLQSDLPATPPSLESGSLPEGGVDNEESFGQRLRRLRKARKISLIGLARLVNVSKPTVWKWERDAVRPRQRSIQALCAALDVAERELVFGTRERNRQPKGSSVAAQVASSTSSQLGAVVSSCKAQIAEVAGTTPDNVSITIQI